MSAILGEEDLHFYYILALRPLCLKVWIYMTLEQKVNGYQLVLTLIYFHIFV